MHPELVMFMKQSVLVVFFAIFVGVIVYAVRLPKSQVEAMSQLPLASDEFPLESGGGPRG